MEPSPVVKRDGDRAEALDAGNQGFSITVHSFFSLLHERFVRKRTYNFTLYILMFKFYPVYGIVNKKILVHNY